MAELKELKAQFLRDVLAYGIEHPPQVKLREWVEQLRRPPLEPLGSGRLANHFTIGASAEVVGITALAEVVRAGQVPTIKHLGFISQKDSYKFTVNCSPARSTLLLTAAMWRGLQMLNQIVPEVTWQAGVGILVGNWQSCNSIVGFGRKGPNRMLEVKALDAVYAAAIDTGMFGPSHNNSNRLRGDWSARRYGLPGEIESHHWGYSYHSLPSFVQSPEQMLVMLTLAKLAVLSATEVSNWLYVNGKAEARLLNLLAKYKGLDDDARLTYWWVAKHGLPKTEVRVETAWSLKKPASQHVIKSTLPLELKATTPWVQLLLDRLRGLDVKPEIEPVWWKTYSTTGTEAWRLSSVRQLQKALWGLKCLWKPTIRLVSAEQLAKRKKTGKLPKLVITGYPAPLAPIRKLVHGPVLIEPNRGPEIEVAQSWLQKDALGVQTFREVLTKYCGFYSGDEKKLAEPHTAKGPKYIFNSNKVKAS